MEPARRRLSQLMLLGSLLWSWALQPAHTLTAFAFFFFFLVGFVLNTTTFLPFNLNLRI